MSDELDEDFAWTSAARKKKPEPEAPLVPQRRAGEAAAPKLKKYRVTFVAIKRKVHQRDQATGVVLSDENRATHQGVKENFHEDILFREEASVTIEAASKELAIEQATKHLPKDCELTTQVSEVSK
jgi:hypothetical protein